MAINSNPEFEGIIQGFSDAMKKGGLSVEHIMAGKYGSHAKHLAIASMPDCGCETPLGLAIERMMNEARIDVANNRVAKGLPV